MRTLFVVLAALAVSTAAQARCVCECVNGHVEHICESTIDIPPLALIGIDPPCAPGMDPPPSCAGTIGAVGI